MDANTDIAFAKLVPSLQYSRETFSSQSDGNVEPFDKILDETKYRIRESVYVDTPFNGRCEGNLTRVEVRQVTASENTDENQYHIGIYVYFGTDVLLDGCRGAVIWNEYYDVLGQLGFQEDSNVRECYYTSFASLGKLGWKIADV